MVTGSIGCYKISRFKLEPLGGKYDTIAYLFIGVFVALNANRLSDSLALRIGVILELILHTGTILEVSWVVNTLGESLS